MSILPRNVNYYYDNLTEDKNLSSTNILSGQKNNINNNIDCDYDLFFYMYQTDLQNTINKNSQHDLSNINKVNSLAS